MRVNVLFYAPTGGSIEDVTIEGGDPGVTSQTHGGLSVVGKTINLPAGTSVSLHFRINTGLGHAGTLVVRTTPLADMHASGEEGTIC